MVSMRACAEQTPLERLVIQKVVLALQESILFNHVDPFSAIGLIAKVMEIIETFDLHGENKLALLGQVLEKVAVGRDGISGTADDLISPQVVRVLVALLENNLIGDIACTLIQATKGALQLNIAPITNAITPIMTSFAEDVPTKMACCMMTLVKVLQQVFKKKK